MIEETIEKLYFVENYNGKWIVKYEVNFAVYTNLIDTDTPYISTGADITIENNTFPHFIDTRNNTHYILVTYRI